MRPKTVAHPSLSCAVCLFRLGFGYDRISRRIFVKKRRVANFISLRVRKRGLKKPTLIIRPKKELGPKDPIVKAAKRIESKTRRQRVVRLRRYVWRWMFRQIESPIAEKMSGCTRDQFRRHIELRFSPGMSWENYATKWQLDHILPCKIFDLSDPEQIKKCFHFSNYQPLNRSDNAKKSAKILPSQPQFLI
jgi:hypothetical protein